MLSMKAWFLKSVPLYYSKGVNITPLKNVPQQQIVFVKLVTKWSAWERCLAWWNMSIRQSMQVSIETLRAATTRCCQTDRVSGDTSHPIWLPSQTKGREVREKKHPTSTNDTSSKLCVLTNPASKAHEPGKTCMRWWWHKVPPSMTTLKGTCSCPALAQVKLHLNYI